MLIDQLASSSNDPGDPSKDLALFAQRVEANWVHFCDIRNHNLATFLLLSGWNLLNLALAAWATPHVAILPCLLVSVVASIRIYRNVGWTEEAVLDLPARCVLSSSTQPISMNIL